MRRRTGSAPPLALVLNTALRRIGRAGIEYDHLMMGNANNSYSCGAICANVANTVSQNIDMVTVRLNYKFGGPVVARY